MRAEGAQAPAPGPARPGEDALGQAGAGQGAPDIAGGNLQAWAREVRYAAAQDAADRASGEGRDACIATGHTASDQVETILYRLAASPGRRALLGMPAVEGRLIRPLLGVTREQTAAYCEERGLRWREDASNDDERFARARVRNTLVPALRAVHPAAESNVLRTALLLREETELLGALVDAELGGAREIALARLGELPAALARMVVVRLAEDAAGTYVPQAGERVQELLALAARGGRAELHVGGQRGRGDRGRRAAHAPLGAARHARQASGAVAAARRRERAAWRGLDLARWRVPREPQSSRRSARCSSAPRKCSAASPSSASRSRATTPDARCC